MILGLILVSNTVALRFQLDERFALSHSSVIILFQFKLGMRRGYQISVSSCSFLMNMGIILMFYSVVLRFQLDKQFTHSHSYVITPFQFKQGMGGGH